MAAPNVLWICTDQQRFDSLGCYGNDVVETPNIDRLAEQGVRFDRCFGQSPVCTPSRASFLTGRYPRTTGVRQNGQAIPDSEVPVTRYLADEGYTCGLSGKLHIAPSDPTHEDHVPAMERRIDDGYAEVHWSHDPREYIRDEYWPTNEYHHWLTERGVEYNVSDVPDSKYVQISMPPEHHQTTWCAEKAITFIKRAEASARPWLFSVNFFDPHVPFDPPQEFLDKYRDRLEEIDLPNYDPGELTDMSVFHQNPPSATRFPYDEMDEHDHRLLRAAYYAMIDLVDDQVGRMLDALEATGQREDTIVVFMSDHGELLGDHGIYLKGPYFYEPAVRLPLVLSWPGEIEPGVRNELVELTDLAPTLLNAVGLESGEGMQGRSFWPLLQGTKTGHREDVYAEYYHALERERFYGDDYQGEGGWTNVEYADPGFTDTFGTAEIYPPAHEDIDALEEYVLPYATMLRTDRYKLVKYHTVDDGVLYDLEVDPDERVNCYDDPDYCDIKVDLLERLADRMAGTIDPLPPRYGRF